MSSHFIETKIIENGTLILQDLPFINGEEVDIILLKHQKNNKHNLRGTKFKYKNPTDPVAENDWESSE